MYTAFRGGGAEPLNNLRTAAVNSVSSQKAKSLNAAVVTALSTETADVSSVSTASVEESASLVSTQSLTETLAENTISSSVYVEAGQTITIDIDGVSYKVKNLASSGSEFGYVKNLDTGEITFNSNYFDVTGQTDKQHIVTIKGYGGIFRGGDLNDTIVINSNNKSIEATVYAGDGDDTITVASNSSKAAIYCQKGTNVVTSYASAATIYGGTGNNTYNVHFGGESTWIYGSSTGQDIFNLYGASTMNERQSIKAFGYGGDDVFNIDSACKYVFVDGGTGNNTIYDYGKNTTKINVQDENGNDVSNTYAVEFGANETKTVSIDGKNYTVTRRGNAGSLYYTLVDGVITFQAGNFTIEAQKDVAHNVKIENGIYFTGGDLADKIELTIGTNNVVHGGDGDDEIIISSTYTSSCYVYGEDGNDTITLSKKGLQFCSGILDGGEGDDTFNLYNTGTENVFGRGGNDTFNIDCNNNIIDCGDGDDTVNYMNNNLYNNIIIGGDGNNSINSSSGVNYTTDFADSLCSRVDFSTKGETKTLSLNGVSYTATNNADGENSLLYFYNSVSDEVVFGGSNIKVQGQGDKAHNVRFFANSSTLITGVLDDKIWNMGSFNYIYAGKGDDYIYSSCRESANLYGEDGNDTFDCAKGLINAYGGQGDDIFNLNNAFASYSTYNGGDGDDVYNCVVDNNKIVDSAGNNIYYIDSDNNNITGGFGNETFYINGNNNNILGQGGDDYLIVNGDNNYVDGGSGTNLLTGSSTTSTIINATTDPNSGELRFSVANETKTISIDGKTYTFTNVNSQGASVASHVVSYSYNTVTKELILEGSDYTLDSSAGAEHNIRIKGSNNVINGGDKNDTIIVESGSKNIINGNDGDDSITLNSANNSAIGGSGNDNITLNASTTKEISGGDGNDVITINSNNNTNISTGSGNDRITGTGNSNNIQLGDDNNNTVLNGNNNTIVANDGNNNISVIGSTNTIEIGNGKNTIGVQGNQNVITTGDGKNDFVIYGNTNNVTSGSGDDTYKIKGNQNIVDSAAGNDTIDINGNENTLNAGAGNDDVTISGDKNIANGNEDNDKFKVKSGNLNEIDGNDGDNTLIDNGKNTISNNVSVYKYEPIEIRLQIGANKDDFITINLSLNTEDFDLDFSTPEASAINLDTIDELMTNVNRQLASIGAVLNRLESVLSSQTTTIENYTAARSTILDADIAEESAKYTKAMILQQTTSALLAQTKNFNASLVLALIS